MTAPIPEEFSLPPDNYADVPDMWVDADYYLDGVLVHPARRTPEPRPPEHEPGWTVQRGRHGEAA